MTVHMKTLANNGSGVSTMERDEFTKLLGALSGVDVAEYELAVFTKGHLLFDDPSDEDMEPLSMDDTIPVHVEYFDTHDEAVEGHERVVAAINDGTLEYSGVPETRR